MHALWQLAVVFVPLSLVTIGGGLAVVADIQRQAVDHYHWMTQAQFVNDFAISRMAPGPGSLLATLIGWQVAGLAGAVVATLSLFGPTAFLIYGVAHAWRRYRGARWQTALEAGLRPVAAGMILAAGYGLLRALEGGWLAQSIAALSTLLLMRTRLNPILLLAAGAAVFVLAHGLRN
jgi:chromate transporter